MNFIEKFIGSGFYSGYLYLSKNKKNSASGTIGSFFALLIYLIPGFENYYIIIPAIILFTFIGIPISTKFEKEYGKDPKECTIDEVVGMWISLLFLPKTLIVIIITFLVWRIFDIVKIFPANYFDKKNGGINIMLDDIISAIYTSIVIHILLYLINIQ
jgi:phosphatidylglycerophosphatase A